MAVDPIGGNEKMSPVHEAVRMVYQKAAEDRQASSIQGTGGDTVSVSLRQSTSTMEKLGSVNAENNLLAKGVRETDKTLQEVSSVAVKMKERLETIVKNFPPFTMDSAERKDLLMSYIALRKEIEKMTFPKPPAPVYENNKKLWEKLDFTDNQKFSEAIPVLDETSSDYQVRRAVGSLDTIQTNLGDGRNELYRAVAG